MPETARTIESQTTQLTQARVAGGEGGKVLLLTDRGLTPARRAAGCLLAPERGDLVLAALSPGDESWVISVLERAGAGPARLDVPGDLILSAPRGRLELAALEEVDLVSLKKVEMTAPEFQVGGGRARVELESLDILVRLVSAGFHKVKSAAQSVEESFGRLTQRLGNCFRQVEELDRTEAGTISQEADDLFSARGAYAQLTADEDVKIDGSMIHLG